MTWWYASAPDSITPRPWMHPAAVEYLSTLLNANSTVLEHGCGGSTLWLAERVARVDFVEHDQSWRDAVLGWRYGNVSALTAPPEHGRYDVVLIDGFSSMRPQWLSLSPRLCKPGGVVVLDDSHRELYHTERGALALYCNDRVTVIRSKTGDGKLCETAFFRMPGGETWI